MSMREQAEGLWPGVVAITADADMYCLDCARKQYGKEAIDIVVDGTIPEGAANYPTDGEGNSIHVVLADSEDAQDLYCRGVGRKPHR